MTETLLPDTDILSHAASRTDASHVVTTTQSVVYICSVAPIPRTAHRDHNVVHTVTLPNGRTGRAMGLGVDYVLPAARRDSYKVLAVYDTFQLLRSLNEFKGELEESMEKKDIPAVTVANDLLAQWTTSVLGGAQNVYPGIGIIRGPVPTPEELSHLRAVNTLWCEWGVNDAGEHYAKGYTNDIHTIHRKMAEWLYDTGAYQFEWYKERKQLDLKDCPACLTKIPARATACGHCHTNLITFYVSYGGEPDAFVKTFVDREMEKLTQPTPAIKPPMRPAKEAV